jgi:ABC-type transporter Mla MlaB component
LAEPDAPQRDAASAPLIDSSGTVHLEGRIDRADVGDLCARLERLLRTGDPGPLRCDIGKVDEAAIPAVDVLARLVLAARRENREVRLEHASPEILELAALCGLLDQIRPEPDD